MVDRIYELFMRRVAAIGDLSDGPISIAPAVEPAMIERSTLGCEEKESPVNPAASED
jgi:hypothetical protein